jgi:hypothetical protein
VPPPGSTSAFACEDLISGSLRESLKVIRSPFARAPVLVDEYQLSSLAVIVRVGTVISDVSR